MKWIQINEKLPPKNKTLLVTDGAYVYTAYFSDAGNFFCECNCFDGSYVEGVTHWMILPKLP